MAVHQDPAEKILRELGSDAGRGLSVQEARRRLEEGGANQIGRGKEISPFRILAAQFNDFLVWLLIAAAGVSVGTGLLADGETRFVDSVLILLIVGANGLFGFLQDYRAERAIEMLRSQAIPEALVLRDGRRVTVSATEIVPGDIILIETGDRIPADARLLESHSLETVEAALTGESATVPKHADPIEGNAPLAERRNMVFMQTNAVKGRARAVVTATGMDTEVGAIATQIQEAEERATPFQEEVNRLGKSIGFGVLGLITIIGLLEYFFGGADLITTLLLVVTLAVAAVPEGLPAVVTVTLALGARRLADQKALTRQLSVIESLGSIDVIVTDKTGTLTRNEMTVERLYCSGRVVSISGEERGPGTTGEADRKGSDQSMLEPLLRCGATANNAENTSRSESARFFGDPTELALLIAAEKAGIQRAGRRVREIPFSSERKRMTVIVEGSPPVAFLKGAPEVVMERCNRVWEEGSVRPLTEELRRNVQRQNELFAESALRVIACASKEIDDPDADEEEIENGLVFLGLQAMIDPPRPGVKDAVEDCRRAGIRVVMATGDSLETAISIGTQLGFEQEGAMTGSDLDALSDEEVQEVAGRIQIFARVSPEHKVKLLKALQQKGHRVAMTGDGVNDAPALQNADVGVAMGLRGTDVAREASDMVLQDDNFVTLRNAIAEGRGLFDNIQKFVNFLLSANAGEILIVFFGILAGASLFPDVFQRGDEALILTPVMLLWINLATDGLPALALGIDPQVDGIMTRRPRPPDEPLIDNGVLWSILVIGLVMTLAGLPLFFASLAMEGSLVTARTALFTFIVVAEMVAIQVIRVRYSQSLTSNHWLILAVFSSLAIHGVVLYSPLNTFFGVQPLSAGQWMWVAVALFFFALVTAVAHRAGKGKRSGFV